MKDESVVQEVVQLGLVAEDLDTSTAAWEAVKWENRCERTPLETVYRDAIRKMVSIASIRFRELDLTYTREAREAEVLEEILVVYAKIPDII